MTHDVDDSLDSEYMWRHHKHEIGENQCTSVLLKRIRAPVNVVWSIVRKFDEPQQYKPFVQSCSFQGDVIVGSVRDVSVISGLPATNSKEKLEVLDDLQHVFSYRILGGDHRLQNYWSVITLHSETINGKPGTLAIESFVVDVPEGNTKEETTYFVEALIKCNLKSLADKSERIAFQEFSRSSGTETCEVFEE